MEKSINISLWKTFTCDEPRHLAINQLLCLNLEYSKVSAIYTPVFSFIWHNKPDKIRYILYQDYKHGGLRAPNISVLVKALLLACIRRLHFSESNKIEKWKTIPDYFFLTNFLLRCNCNKNPCKNSKFPLSYTEILDVFREL